MPIAGAVICLAQMIGLPLATWERLGIWLVAGLVIYATYGFRRAGMVRAPQTSGSLSRPARRYRLTDPNARSISARRFGGDMGDNAIVHRHLATSVKELEPARLNRVRIYIDRHCGQPVRIAQLAHSAGLSRFHFIRSFRAATGLTPHQYVRERRIQRARHLLETTKTPITEICAAVGFRSLGSFSTVFRKLTGESPAAYRRRCWRPAYIPQCFVRMYRVGR